MVASDFWRPILDAFDKGWNAYGISNDFPRKGWADLKFTDSPEEAVAYADQGVPYKTSAAQFKIVNAELQDALERVYNAPRSVVLIGKQYADGPEVEIAKTLSREVVRRFNVPVRVTNRRVVFDGVFAAAKKEGWLDKLHAVCYTGPLGLRPLTEDEKSIGERLVMIQDPSVHQLASTSNAYAYMFLPGDIGTMNRLFEILTLIQTGKLARKPVLLVGRKFWQPIMDAIFKAMLERADGLKFISEQDSRNIKIVDEDNVE